MSNPLGIKYLIKCKNEITIFTSAPAPSAGQCEAKL